MSAVQTEKPALHVMQGGAGKFKSVELAKRQDNQDAWALADAVFDDVIGLLPPDAMASGAPENSANSGLNDAENAVFDAHRQAGTEVSRSYLHNLFVTRRVWPPEERLPDKASFNAHFDLRGKDWKNRRQILERLAARSRTGRATRHQVKVYISEKRPPEFRTFIQLIDKRVRAVVKTSGHPWHLVADVDRERIADLLRTLAHEIESGEFPKAAK
jgi:hypothetical protein